MENNLDSINISNLSDNNLNKLSQFIIELNEYKNKNLKNNNKELYDYFYQKIKKKFIEFSYYIYLEAYICKKEKESELVNLQEKLLGIYKLYFTNTTKIKYYLDGMRIILFLRFAKKPILKNDILYWENSSGQLNKNNIFKQKYDNNIRKFLELINSEFYINLQNSLSTKKLDLIKKESIKLNTICKIYFDYNLNKLMDSFFEERIKKFYINFLENIYKAAKNSKDVNFLSYLEIYNNVFAEFGSYFGYPNNENNNHIILKKNLEELFKILKNLDLNKKEEQSKMNKKENIKKGVQLTMNSLLGKVKNRINEKLDKVNNYSSINNNINRQNSLSELKRIAEEIFILFNNTSSQTKSKKLHLLFKKIITKIQNSILPTFYKNINNIHKIDKKINQKINQNISSETYLY